MADTKYGNQEEAIERNRTQATKNIGGGGEDLTKFLYRIVEIVGALSPWNVFLLVAGILYFFWFVIWALTI